MLPRHTGCPQEVKVLRNHITLGARVPFFVVIPILEGHDLDHASRTADSISKTFFEDHKPSGNPGISGIWTSGMVERGRVGRISRRSYPTLVYSGAIRNKLTVFEMPDEAVDALTAMLEAVVPKIDVDLETASIVMVYGDREYHFSEEHESVSA